MCLLSGPEGIVEGLLGQSQQLPVPRLSHVLGGSLVAMLGRASEDSVLLVEMVRLILMGSCASLTEWPVGCAYLLIQH